ncbi:MAG TPA: hypothetical protein VMN38_07195 [Sphingomicrobium sp.]|nr:hypothetical protein [Sphingomicrobium sp.]
MADSTNKPLATITHFPPVPLRPRWSGWTPDKQIAFVEALSETACVVEAARIVGMSAVGAYALRRRPCAHHFREAWDAALDMGVQRLEQVALGRALNGVPRPVFYKGEQVGEWREYDERLAMFLLRYRRPARFGAALDHVLAPVSDSNADPLDEAAITLNWHCDEIGELDPGQFEEQADVDPPADAPAASPPAEFPRADGA